MNTLIAITGLGILVLLLEIFNLRKAIVPLTLLGLAGAFGVNAMEYGETAGYFSNMVVTSPYSSAFSGLFIILTIFLVAMSRDFYSMEPGKLSDFVSIKVFLCAGAIAMVSFGNLAMFFLGIEVLSISIYILAASDRLNIRSNEAGMKYFLMGSFASGVILFGICLIYGATGFFDIAEIYELSKSEIIPNWFFIGLILMAAGMLFKIAAVPFHFWAPDVYEGAPALTTATMSTLAKVASMAALFKIASTLNANVSVPFEYMIATIAMLSMIVGNIMALRQQNVKRMLGFSGISHAGYMLLVMFALSTSADTLLYYASAYALAGIAAFAVVLYVYKTTQREDIDAFAGLGKTSPFLAAILTGALISMAGIPIFSGFFAKFMLFNQAIEGGYLAVVIVAVVSSIISIGYYFKIIIAMYMREPESPSQPVPFAFHAVAFTALALNLAIGLFPSLVMQLL